MTLLTIPRAAVGGSLKLVRLPLDSALSLAGSNPSATTARLALDRLEAAVRGLAGAALGDDVLREDARRRGEAAAERERALRLRVEADRRSERADDRVAEQQEAADRRRAAAAEAAQAKQAQARQRSDSRKKQAAQAAQRRKQTAEKSAARTQAAVDEQAKRDRLEALDTKTEALDEKEVALTAADEARRLRDAATRAKAERKNGS
jgi:fused signal recognition particle receptor